MIELFLLCVGVYFVFKYGTIIMKKLTGDNNSENE